MAEEFSILALIAAGVVREDDGFLGLMQNVSRDHAHTIGKWLALTTDGPVHLRWMTIGDIEEIEYTADDVKKAAIAIKAEKRDSSP